MLNLKQIALFAGTISLLFSTFTAANAQASQTTSTEESFRKAAPQLPKPGRFILPKTDSFKLANGLEVLFVEDHRFPYVSTNLGFRTGSSDEPKGKSGIADMTAGLLTEGAADLNSKDLARAVEFIGGGLKADCDYDYTIVSGSCLSAYTDKLLDLFGKVVLKPTFPEEELNLQKVNLIQALNIKRSDPDFLIEERFNKVLFGNHPYSIVAPTEASINKINRNELIKYHQEHYLPNKAVLIVVGDFKPEAMKELLNKHLGESWKAHELNSQVLPEPPKQSGRHIYLVDRPGSVQTSLKVGNLAIKRNSPDFFPMLVANQILGGAAHARLFMNIREDKGFTYGAYSKLSARKALGSFYAQANVRTDVTNPSLLEFLYETEKLRSTRAKDEELDLAKNYLAGSFQLGLETQGGLAQRLLEVKLFDLPADYLETYADKVMAVSAEDVKKASTKLIDSNNMVICAVGDAKKIKADLEIFAPVAVFNPEGTLKSDSSSKSVN
jgi:predicted Zn-dependent peptidase